MTRSALLVFTALAIPIGGCTWPFKRSDTTPLDVAAAGPPKPSLLIGPDAAGHVIPTELAPKEASVACLAAARELDKNGKVPEAIQLYEKARQQDPTIAGVSRRLAVLYDLAGEFEKASVEYDQLLQANPRDPQLLNDVGYSYYCRGDFARAEEFLTRATKLDPQLKRARLNLGLTLAAAGKSEAGLNSFAQVCSEAEARANLGFVLATQGKLNEAREQYKRAIELDPGFALARAALEHLNNPSKSIDSKGERRAGGKSKPATAEDVPTIYELEQRIKQQDDAKPHPESTHPFER